MRQLAKETALETLRGCLSGRREIHFACQTADQRGRRGGYEPRYGRDDIFTPGVGGQFGVKFIF